MTDREPVDLMTALELSLRRCTCGHIHNAHREVTIGSDSRNPPKQMWCELCSCIDFEVESD